MDMWYSLLVVGVYSQNGRNFFNKKGFNHAEYGIEMTLR